MRGTRSAAETVVSQLHRLAFRDCRRAVPAVESFLVGATGTVRQPKLFLAQDGICRLSSLPLRVDHVGPWTAKHEGLGGMQRRWLAKKKSKKEQRKEAKNVDNEEEEEIEAAEEGESEIDTSDIIAQMNHGMTDCLSKFEEDLSRLRTGRADPRMLDKVTLVSCNNYSLVRFDASFSLQVKVKAYDSEMMMPTVAQVVASDPKALSVTVFDPDLVSAVEKAIRSSGLDLNPQVAGTSIKCQIPKVTQEQRQKLAKMAAGMAEQAKVSLRRVRHTYIEKGNKLKLPKDDARKFDKEVQGETDKFVKEVETKLKAKQTELTQAQ